MKFLLSLLAEAETTASSFAGVDAILVELAEAAPSDWFSVDIWLSTARLRGSYDVINYRFHW